MILLKDLDGCNNDEVHPPLDARPLLLRQLRRFFTLRNAVYAIGLILFLIVVGTLCAFAIIDRRGNTAGVAGEHDDGEPTPPPQSAIKGVILFLYGGNHKEYFVKHTLPSLELHYLSCHANKYPVHIFYEAMTAEERRVIRALVPSASHVVFEDVSRFWRALPHNITDAEMTAWEKKGKKRFLSGRGYRTMCRFWFGLVWQLPSMQQYDYYWRLDTDSVLIDVSLVDPFEFLVSNNCSYGWNDLQKELPYAVEGLRYMWDWWVGQTMTLETRQRVFALTHENGNFWAPMYYNNFEVGAMRLKTHPTYQAFFKFIDESPPYGIYRYRWGDAPLHTLGIYSVYEGNITGNLCEINQTLLPYGHNKKPVPDLDYRRKCTVTSA